MDVNSPVTTNSDFSVPGFTAPTQPVTSSQAPSTTPAQNQPAQATQSGVSQNQVPVSQPKPYVPPTLPPIQPQVQTPTSQSTQQNTQLTAQLKSNVSQSTPTQPGMTLNNSIPHIQILGTNSSGNLTVMQMMELVASRNASDLHLVVGYPPMIRVDGALIAISSVTLTNEAAKKLIYDVLPDAKKEELEVNREVDLGYGYEGIGRFRINAYYQRGYISAAFRLIPTRIRSIDELRLPPQFHEFPKLEQGFVLVTGPTGHGKSTTLAAMVQEINDTQPKHVLTIEDPIEYVFPQSKAVISQRELGEDTHSWKAALRVALREDPDVVLVGEMRDFETISAALTVAETGHLVFATLHTNSAAQTIQRIINVFPDVQQEEVRAQLADILQVVVAQRLIPIKGGGRRAAVEIMTMTPAIRNLIRENKIFQIDNVIRTSLDIGMITLERSLLNLYHEGLIDQDMALRYALDSSEMIRLIQEG